MGSARRGTLAAAIALCLASTADAQEVRFQGLTIEVDPSFPTSLYALGFPRPEKVYAVGDTIGIVSWPALPGRDPAVSRVPGTVTWSVVDHPDAVTWIRVTETHGLLVIREASSTGEPFKLLATLHPRTDPWRSP